MYATIDMSSKLLLGIDVYSRRRTDSAAVFFHHLREKHDVADAEFLVDGGGYLTALFRTLLGRGLLVESCLAILACVISVICTLRTEEGKMKMGILDSVEVKLMSPTICATRALSK